VNAPYNGQVNARSVVLMAVALAPLACDTADEACSPGARATCACDDGRQGFADCAADGSAFGACLCGGAGPASWSRSFGAVGHDDVGAIAVAGDGSVMVVGGFEHSASWGGEPLVSAGAADAYVARLGADGSHLASWRFGDGEEERARAVAVVADGDVLVAGYFAGAPDLGDGARQSLGAWDVFFARFAPDGGLRFSRSFGGELFDGATGVAVTAEGDVYVSGFFQAAMTVGPSTLEAAEGGMDGFLVKLDAGGEVVWARRFGAAGDDQLLAVAVADDGVWVAGRAALGVECDTELIVNGPSDGFLCKLAHDGTALASLLVGGLGADELSSVAHAGGNVVALGTFEETLVLAGEQPSARGESDVLVVRLDAEANALGLATLGGGARDHGAAIALDAGGRTAVGGSFAGALSSDQGGLVSEGVDDALIASFDAAGTFVVGYGFGGAGRDQAAAVAWAPDGALVIAGSFEQPLDFGAGRHLARGARDAFVAKLP
jgi:hypothetical protein